MSSARILKSSPVSKPALGRGLDDLMGKAAGPKQLTSIAPLASETTAGPGVSSLLKGTREDSGADQEQLLEMEPVAMPEQVSTWFPLWYLFAADVLLVVCALFLVFRDPATLTWKRLLFACITTLLGAALAIAGAYMKDQKDGH